MKIKNNYTKNNSDINKALANLHLYVVNSKQPNTEDIHKQGKKELIEYFKTISKPFDPNNFKISTPNDLIKRK